MNEHDRVLDAFRNCITEPKCKDCPWDECDTLNNRCAEIPIDLALAVMRELVAQEPRVMTLEEAQGEDEVWFEFRPSNVGRYADCYMHDTGDRTRVYFTGKSVMSLFENADYGTTWRCWTAKPTEEQRKEVKWDEDQC